MAVRTNAALLEELESFREAREYWLAKLSGELPDTTLQPDSFDGPTQERYDTIVIRLEEELSRKVSELGRGKELLVYVIFVSALKLVLHYYTGQKEITVGSPIHYGFDQDAEYNVGVLLRDRWEDDITFKQLLMQVNATAADAYRYQYYPMDRALELLDLGESPMFRILAAYRGIHDAAHLGALREAHGSDLALEFRQEAGTFVTSACFRADRFRTDSIERLLKSMTHLLTQALDRVDAKLSEFSFMTDADMRIVLESFNDTALPFERDRTIAELFEQQADRHPDRSALTDGERVVTYRELNDRAAAIADVLRGRGVGAGMLVGVLAERSTEMFAAILGILKAGGAYLPLDPAYPAARIGYMLEDSRTVLVLRQAHLPMPDGYGGVSLTLGMPPLDGQPPPGAFAAFPEIAQRAAGPEDPAYVIYTSGSTGNPKGVVVPHRGVACLKAFFEQELAIGPEERIVQFASASFDASVWETFMALLTGATLCLPDQSAISHPEQFTAWMNRCCVTVATLPPPYAAYLRPESLPSLRMLITAGSEASRELVERWRPHVRYINAYGPTESTVCATIWCAERKSNPDVQQGIVPIGRPIANAGIYIVNPAYPQQMQPIGTVGEICIGGAGIARGYLNRPELTAERFVSDPWHAGERLYRTGDLGKWLEDGTIAYLGRIDHQVKIRGYRIETGEIEGQLLQLPEVIDAAVIARKNDSGDAVLCAYYTASEPIAAGALKAHLRKRLPDYMIPAHIMRLQAMPLTRSGKVDRAALPAPGERGDYIAPRNDTEAALASIWQAVFALRQVGVTDHFFDDLGGHSLKAAELANALHSEMGVNVPLQTIFRCPTIELLAEALPEPIERAADSLRIARAGHHGDYPLSSAQQRLFVIQHLAPDDTSYNLPLAFEVDGELSPAKLEAAIQQLVDRHESLRTTYHLVDGEPVQRVHERARFELEQADSYEGSLQQAVDAFIRPFRLEHPPLLRVKLVQGADGPRMLLFDVHHIAADGVSLGILLEELMLLLEDAGTAQPVPLPSPEITYVDYVHWSRNRPADAMAKHKRYWLDQYAGRLPSARLPTDYPRTDSHASAGDRIRLELDEALARALRRTAADNGVTLHMALLTVYSILLGKYAASEDVVIGSLHAGRGRPELERVVGMFVGTLALRCRPAADKTYEQLLREMNETTLGAYAHQEYPIEELALELGMRDAARSTLFDTMFILQNLAFVPMRTSALCLTPYDYERKHSRFELVVQAFEHAEGITLVISYYPSLYHRETIERLGEDFAAISRAVVRDPGTQVRAIALQSDSVNALDRGIDAIDFQF
jgi:fengycin family lipopeptide synthetase D